MVFTELGYLADTRDENDPVALFSTKFEPLPYSHTEIPLFLIVSGMIVCVCVWGGGDLVGGFGGGGTCGFAVSGVCVCVCVCACVCGGGLGGGRRDGTLDASAHS